MNTYIVQWKRRDGTTPWQADHMGEDTPTSLRGAAFLYEVIEAEGHEHDAMRVIMLDEDACTFKDVTNEVLQYIFDKEVDTARQAAEDKAHERQERHRWEQV